MMSASCVSRVRIEAEYRSLKSHQPSPVWFQSEGHILNVFISSRLHVTDDVGITNMSWINAIKSRHYQTGSATFSNRLCPMCLSHNKAQDSKDDKLGSRHDMITKTRHSDDVSQGFVLLTRQSHVNLSKFSYGFIDDKVETWILFRFPNQIKYIRVGCWETSTFNRDNNWALLKKRERFYSWMKRWTYVRP